MFQYVVLVFFRYFLEGRMFRVFRGVSHTRRVFFFLAVVVASLVTQVVELWQEDL